MVLQLAIGTGTILASMAVIIGFVAIAMNFVRAIERYFTDHRIKHHQFVLILSCAVLLVLAANTICVWIWAFLFRSLGVFATMEEAIYFAMISFTTVGYGDVVVERGWRILAGFVAVNGLLAFGIFTAFLIEIVRDLSSRYLPKVKRN